jgi:hypothetical protein
MIDVTKEEWAENTVDDMDWKDLARIAYDVMLDSVKDMSDKEFQEYLPKGLRHVTEVVSPNHKPPPHFELVVNCESKGDYPGVFDYKFVVLDDKFETQIWAYLLWDQIIIITFFTENYEALEKYVKTT